MDISRLSLAAGVFILLAVAYVALRLYSVMKPPAHVDDRYNRDHH